MTGRQTPQDVAKFIPPHAAAGAVWAADRRPGNRRALAIALDEVLAQFATGTDGLTQQEAERRLGVYGPNQLPEAKPRSPLVRLLVQFHSLLIYVLLVAAGLAAFIAHYIDALVILAVVIVNAVIGFIQEGRAEQALAAIRTMIDPRASVFRECRRVTVPAEYIVPGDFVILEPGDRVPADLRLVRTRNLRIDEAILTGESVAVEKATDPVEAGASLGDRLSIAFSGTFVAAGHGAGVAVATGATIELGTAIWPRSITAMPTGPSSASSAHRSGSLPCAAVS